jgi:hypothetical protein
MIKFLVITFLILLILRWVLKPFIKFTVYSTVQKMATEQQKKYDTYHQDKKRAEGSINVDYIPENGKKSKGNNKSGGEYVDYEEIK